MKKLLFFFLLISSICAAQGPPTAQYTNVAGGYQWNRGYFKALHLPVGCGFPFLAAGQWTASGAMYIDTCANKMYRYTGGGVWKAVADSGSAGNQRFGKLGEDVTAMGDRAFNVNGNFLNIYGSSATVINSTDEVIVSEDGGARMRIASGTAALQGSDVSLIPGVNGLQLYNLPGIATPGATDSQLIISVDHKVSKAPVSSGGGGSPNADTIIYASQYPGIVGDADISSGSTSFGTDNGTALNAMLALGTHTQSLKVIWDVKVSTSTTLLIGPNTSIEALPGMGAILRNGSNVPLFRNRDTAFGREPVDSNIFIQGGVWNGNAYNAGSSPAQTKGTTGGGLCTVFSFFGVRNLTVRDLTILRQPTYAIQGINIKTGLYENLVVDCGPNGAINSDGVHFDGGSENCTGRNLNIRSFDDAFAMNADDLYNNAGYAGGVAIGYYPLTANAPISNILWENIYLNGGLFGGRVLGATHRVDNVTVRNVKGFTTGYAFIIDNFWQSPSSLDYPGPGNVGTIQVSDVDVKVDDFTTFTVSKSIINVNCNADKLIFNDIKRNYTFANSIPSIFIQGGGSIVQSLVVNGYDALDTSAFTTSHILNNGIVRSTTITRMNVKRRGSPNYSALIENEGSMPNVTINGAVADSTYYLFYNGSSNVSTITASNIVHKSPLASFFTVSAFDTLTLSNYKGVTKTSGTYGVTTGDAFGSSGLSGVTTFGSTPNANGLSTSGSNVLMQPADATHPGGVSTGSQTFGGAKTFNAQVNVSYSDNSFSPTLILNNTNSGIGGETGLYLVNDASVLGGIELYSSGFLLPSYRNNVGFIAHKGMVFTSDVNVSTGGADPISFNAGGSGTATTLHIAPGNPGKVGIGTTSPTSMLSVGGSSDFQVTSAGKIAKYNNTSITNGKLLIGHTSNGTFELGNIASADGSVTVTNNAGGIDLSVPVATELTYTPTLTNTTNVAASTAYTTYYTRVGNTVFVWGDASIDATAPLTITEIEMSLPVASNFANTYELSGSATFEDNTVLQIKADATNDRAMFRGAPQTATNNRYSFNYTYKVIN